MLVSVVPVDECRYRLGVRTRGSQPRDRGSIPRTATNSHPGSGQYVSTRSSQCLTITTSRVPFRSSPEDDMTEPKISFRGVRSTDALHAFIRERVMRLERYKKPITNC